MASQLLSHHFTAPSLPRLPSHLPSSSSASAYRSAFVPRASSSSPPPQLPASTSADSYAAITALSKTSTSPVSSSSSSLPLPPLPLNALLPWTVGVFPMLLGAQDALAVDGQFGLLEGRTAALVHPIVMGGLLIYTLWAGYLGWQWRRVRTVQDEINLLKKELAPAAEGAPPSPTELKIKELTEVRKDLIKGGFRDRHFNAGSILLAFGVLEAVGGCLNTWFRTGKLFPGPHLFAGAGITVLWALAASLVPAMQKGNDTARSLHIGLNAVNVILFLSQVPTGLEIVLKVLEFTKWP